MSRLSEASRRLPGGQVRNQGMTVKFSPREYAEVRAAAERAGMAMSAWVGMTATSAARHEAVPLRQFQREVITELVRCGWQLGKAGVNLNQAVAKLNATGIPDDRLEPAARWLLKVAERVDATIEHVRSRM
jgi:antitoxin component of RelBE/YafQ-DinJ toxin-antitoxin module